MNAKTKEAAAALLKAHPEKKEIFATEDGNLFWVHHHALDHSKSIKCEVTTITRQSEKPVVKKDETTNAAPEKPADKKPADKKPADKMGIDKK
jgi:hypothetical protein